MNRRSDGINIEDSIAEDWSDNPELVEVRLSQASTRILRLVLIGIVVLVTSRVLYLNFIKGSFYAARAEANANRIDHILAPRGLILDRNGMVLAENRSVYRAILNVDELSKHPELRDKTFAAIERIFGMSEGDIESLVQERSATESVEPVVLGADLTPAQIVALKALDLTTMKLTDAFMRHYTDTASFSSLLGYVSLPTAKDLDSNPSLSSQDLVGKAGVELQYDDTLQGRPGIHVKIRNAKGQVIHEEERRQPEIGTPLTLSIDGEFQKFFYSRMLQGLQSLGRTSGGAIALNPQNGEILALMSFPTYDNGLLSSPGHSDEKRAILSDANQPLFDRMIGGNYSPGSVIKPLDSVALLKEGIVDVNKSVFSPGYLDVPNRYDSAHPSRYLDWRYQGYVNTYSAIAQSSDVYYYVTVGGFGDVKGLGISKLKEWWQKFGLGAKTGVDLPGEKKGFLPDAAWKEKTTGKPWLLGDTFNVSIGQGDFEVTPIQLINYISAIANGGKLYQPTVNLHGEHPKVLADLTSLAPQIYEVQKGMRLTVTSPMGTAYQLHDLPFYIAAKTGSAQIENNTKENAFFAGYIGENNTSPIVILILVEHAKEGSLNAVPIGKDVLNWYHEYRLNK
jgi:penicillin-binding protein 2